LRASDVAVALTDSAEVGDLRDGAGTTVGGVSSTDLVEVTSLAVNVELSGSGLARDVAGNTIISGRAAEELVVGILQVEVVGRSSGSSGDRRRRSLGAASAGAGRLDSAAGGGSSRGVVTALGTEEHAVPPVVDTESTLVKVALVNNLGRSSGDCGSLGRNSGGDRLSNGSAADGDGLVGDTVQNGSSLNSRGSSKLVEVKLLGSRRSGCETGEGRSREESGGSAHSDQLIKNVVGSWVGWLLEIVVELVVDCSVESVWGEREWLKESVGSERMIEMLMMKKERLGGR